MPRTGEVSGAPGVQYVVTLVHGTWAKNAPWVEPDSALSRALQERFGNRVKVYRFRWSGGNSHRARREASERLKNELTDRLKREEFSEARQYLLCHSHGGNVALRAVAGSGLQDKVDGVVCLGTPFLVARERDLGGSPLKHLAGALVVVMLLVMWAMDQIVPAAWPALGRFAAVVLVSGIVPGAFVVLVNKWREHAKRLRCELSSPAVERDKILIIRSPGDEASGALALFQFISQLTVRLYVRAFALYERLEHAVNAWTRKKRKVLAVAAGALALFVVLIFVAASLPWESGFQSWVNVAAVVGAFASLLVCLEAVFVVFGWVEVATVFFRLAASAVVWPVIVLLSVLLLPFGREVAAANILLDVTGETTPPGSWTVHLMEPPTSEELGKDFLPLMHSVVYENPRVLNLVCDWIASGDGAARKGEG